MNQKRIYQLIEKAVLNDKEKQEIKNEAQRLGLNVSFRQGCRSCYETALLRIYEATVKNLNVSKDGYVMKRVTDSFRIGGTVVNNESIKGMKVGMLHPHIVSTFFAKVEPKEAQEEAQEAQGTKQEPQLQPQPKQEPETKEDGAEGTL